MVGVRRFCALEGREPDLEAVVPGSTDQRSLREELLEHRAAPESLEHLKRSITVEIRYVVGILLFKGGTVGDRED